MILVHVEKIVASEMAHNSVAMKAAILAFILSFATLLRSGQPLRSLERFLDFIYASR